MTDLDIYQPAGGIGQYQAGIVMTPESAKALDEQVRACTKAVLREGTDYGHIPGTGGEEKSLWRPGAQKLLQWFGLSCTCDRVEVERDDDGRKHGITYRATVARRLPDGTLDIKATCEGTADYDESKFYQSEEQVKARLRDQEHKWAAKDRRVPNADRWNSAKEYRADWNALMKRAQKRAIVGAVVDATAAGGIFTDREEDESPVPQDDGPTWYQQALAYAASFTDPDDEAKLATAADRAHREGRCSRKEMDHVLNRGRQRGEYLKRHGTPVDAEDLGRQAATQAPAEAADDGRRHVPVPESEKTNVEDEPGTASAAQLTKLHTVLTGLGFNGEDREQKLIIAEVITGHDPLTGPEEGRTSKNLSHAEARKLIDKLDEFTDDNGERDRDALIAYMAERKPTGDGNE